MTISVASSLSVLARDIDARWGPNPLPIIVEELGKWRGVLQNLIIRYNEAIIIESAKFIIEIIGRKNEQLEFILNFIRPELRQYGNHQAILIEGYLRDRIARILANGSSVEEARQTLLSLLRSRGYASRIARTETHTALERGMFEAAKSFAIRIIKSWWTREDFVVRPAHAIAHGQKQELLDNFVVGGEGLMYPGDPSASPRNRSNCRCTSRYELP